MSFHTFVKNTTISAADFDDNYKHIHSETVLPRGGTSLDPTTAVYNLGDTSYRWKTCYANELTVMGEINPTSSITLVAEFTLTQTASSIEIDGLTGETDRCYHIIVNARFTNATGYIKMAINHSSSSVYYLQYINSSLSASYATNTYLYMGDGYNTTSTKHNVYSDIYMQSKSGIKNAILNQIYDSQDLYINYSSIRGISLNITEAISNIKVLADTANMLLTGCNIQIYAMR